MNERDKLIAQLIKEKGGTREQYLQLLDTIATHESAGTLDPSIKQIGGGPGRGVYQFEEGKNRGGITAAKRTKQYYEELGNQVPEWLQTVSSGDSLDASQLTREQQDALFLGNMRKHPKANFKNVWDGKESVADFWANYHWAGKPKDRQTRINSFNDSQNYKKKDDLIIPDNSNSLSVTPDTPKRRVDEPIVPGGVAAYMQTKLAMGGQQQGSSQYTDRTVNMYNGGGTHEQNPLGGIPIGANDSVENDEASFIFKDKGKFIFSHRVDYSKLT